MLASVRKMRICCRVSCELDIFVDVGVNVPKEEA